MSKKRGTKQTGTFEKVRDFVADHPGLLFIVANPGTDEMFTSYAGKAAFVRFPNEAHVVLRVVSPDMFELSIDEFADGMMQVLKTDEEKGVQFIKAVGGAIHSIGAAVANDNYEEENRGTNGQ